MSLLIYNRSSGRVPREYLLVWSKACFREFKKNKILTGNPNVTLVFVTSKVIRELNKKYRSKDYVTDVLSFAPVEPESLGEIVMCYDVLKRQAKEHDLSLRHEMGYMLLHGFLHLLGFDHEKSKSEARKMFQIQDEIFERLIARI